MQTTEAHDLYDYETADYIGPATEAQIAASRAAAEKDGGVGAFIIDSDGDVVKPGEQTYDVDRCVYVLPC